MKRIILILGALLLLLNSQAQNKWVTQIDTMGYSPIKMIQCNNGDLLCIGLTDHYQDSIKVTNKLLINRLNSETGQMICMKKFNENYGNIIEIDNHEILLLTYILDTNLYKIFLYTLDMNFAVIDSSMLLNDSLILRGLINYFDNTIYVYNTNEINQPFDSIFILAIKDNLAVNDSIQLGEQISPRKYVKKNLITILDYNVYSHIKCGKKMKLIQESIDNNHSKIFDIDEKFILTGLLNTSSQSSKTLSFYGKNFDSIFTISSTQFTRTGFTGSDFQTALFTPDAKITLVGTFFNPFAKVKFIQKINLDGSLDGPYKMMWGVGASHLTTVLPAEDGGLYFFGGTDPGTNNYQFVYKSDLCGDVHPDSVCTRYTDPVVIDVAPSLVLDEVVYLDISKRYTGHYWLYDVMGKLLQTGEFKDDFYTVIGFEKYNYGMYFLQIEQEDKSYKTYKVIKQ